MIKKTIGSLSSYVNLDLPYFIGGGFWITIGLLIVSVGGIILSSAFSRIWTATTYGQYSLLLSVLSYLSITSLPGMGQIITQATLERKEGVYKSTINTVFKWSLIGSLILIVGAVYFFIKHDTDMSLIFLLSVIYFPISSATNLFGYYLNGRKQFKDATIFSIISQLFSMSITVLVLLKIPTLSIVVLASFMSTIIINTVLTFISFRRLQNNDQDPELIKLGKNISFSQIFLTSADYMDRFLVPLFLGFSLNAVYAFALIIPTQLHAFLKIFTTLGQPKIIEQKDRTLKKTLLQKSLALEALILTIVLFYILAAPFIFKILYPKYTQSALALSQLFSLSLLYFPGNLFFIGITKKRATKEIYLTNFYYFAASLISLLTLTPLLGLIGVVYSKILGRAVYLICEIYFFKKLFN